MSRRLMLRNESAMAALVQGRYNGLGGSYSIVDTNGAISGERICYFVTIPFTKAISYSAGDVIKLAQDRTYASLSSFRIVKLLGSKNITIVNNKLMNKYAAFTYTVAEDGYIDRIHYDNSSNVQSNITVKPLIYINDELVLGG